jgi:inosine-uridine nucleoside N-ribohydrolase
LNKIKVIIDLGFKSINVDEILALVLALNNPNLEILKVTGMRRCVTNERSYHNLNLLLKELEKKIFLFEEKTPGDSINSLVKTIENVSDSVVLITLGPLTNISLAYKYDPNILGKIDQILLVGGSYRTAGTDGNLSEYNILTDPDAAALIFSMPVPITMFSLDVAKKMKINSSKIERWGNSSLPIVRTIYNTTIDYMDYTSIQNHDNEPFTCFYKSMPIMYCKYPEMFFVKACNIQIDLYGEFTHAMTVVDLRTRDNALFKHKIVSDIEANNFLEALIQDIGDI